MPRTAKLTEEEKIAKRNAYMREYQRKKREQQKKVKELANEHEVPLNTVKETDCTLQAISDASKVSEHTFEGPDRTIETINKLEQSKPELITEEIVRKEEQESSILDKDICKTTKETTSIVKKEVKKLPRKEGKVTGIAHTEPIRSLGYLTPHKFKPGEEVYVAMFNMKNEGLTFSNINTVYKFRPVFGKIRCVVIEKEVTYKIVGSDKCYAEEYVFHSKSECQAKCNKLNLV